jgi:peptidoglycan/LPS O-acetylase OafA/YrhL
MFMHFGLNRVVNTVTGGMIAGGRWDLCVDFFFLLSGFVLCRSFLNRRPSLQQYTDSRIRRLAPMYLVALAIILALPGRTELGVALANVAMIQSLVGVTSINYPSWSIPFELFFPVVMLFAIPHLAMARTGILLTAFFATLLVGMTSTYLMVRLYDLPGLRAASGLGLGGLLYLVRERFEIPERYLRWLSPPLWTGFVIVVILICTPVPLAILAFYPLAILAVVGGAARKSLFSSSVFQELGRLSYSVYLLHIPVLVAAAELAPTIFNHNPALKMALAAVALALSWVTYRTIEEPLMKKRRKPVAAPS